MKKTPPPTHFIVLFVFAISTKLLKKNNNVYSCVFSLTPIFVFGVSTLLSSNQFPNLQEYT